MANSIYNHVYFPLYYEDPVSECRALVINVVFWDMACEQLVEITGPDAIRFVQRLTPRNLTQFQVGECKYILVAAEDGSIIEKANLCLVQSVKQYLM